MEVSHSNLFAMVSLMIVLCESVREIYLSEVSVMVLIELWERARGQQGWCGGVGTNCEHWFGGGAVLQPVERARR